MNNTFARRVTNYVRLLRHTDRWDGRFGNVSDDFFAHPDGVSQEPFVLVERSRFGQVWVTLHATANDAARAHVHQEYAEDWMGDDPIIMNVDTGRHYVIHHTVTTTVIPQVVTHHTVEARVVES